MSIPLWKEEANFVGDDLFPKYELIFLYSNNGHWNLLLDVLSEFKLLIVLFGKFVEIDSNIGENEITVKIVIIMIIEYKYLKYLIIYLLKYKFKMGFLKNLYK